MRDTRADFPLILPITPETGMMEPVQEASRPGAREPGGMATVGPPGIVPVQAEPASRRTSLLALLDRLVDSGKSVIIIEHSLAVMAHADWIVDLGPGAGHDGGRIVFEGTPAELVTARSTLTGAHLATYIGA